MDSNIFPYIAILLYYLSIKSSTATKEYHGVSNVCGSIIASAKLTILLKLHNEYLTSLYYAVELIDGNFTKTFEL